MNYSSVLVGNLVDFLRAKGRFGGHQFCPFLSLRKQHLGWTINQACLSNPL
jgi:hypothetical protein